MSGKMPEKKIVKYFLEKNLSHGKRMVWFCKFMDFHCIFKTPNWGVLFCIGICHQQKFHQQFLVGWGWVKLPDFSQDSKENVEFMIRNPSWYSNFFPPTKTKMTGWKIHHEWVDVFPIKHGGFPISCSWTQGFLRVVPSEINARRRYMGRERKGRSQTRRTNGPWHFRGPRTQNFCCAWKRLWRHLFSLSCFDRTLFFTVRYLVVVVVVVVVVVAARIYY